MKFFLSGEIDVTRPKDLIDKKFQVACESVSDILTPILEENDYGEEVLELNIIPIVVKLTEEMEKAGWHKERKLFKRKSHSADFRLRIDYDAFCKTIITISIILYLCDPYHSIDLCMGWTSFLDENLYI